MSTPDHTPPTNQRPPDPNASGYGPNAPRPYVFGVVHGFVFMVRACCRLFCDVDAFVFEFSMCVFSVCISLLCVVLPPAWRTRSTTHATRQPRPTTPQPRLTPYRLRARHPLFATPAIVHQEPHRPPRERPQRHYWQHHPEPSLSGFCSVGVSAGSFCDS